MHVLEFIDKSNKAKTLEELVMLFCQALDNYGYNKFCSFTDEGLQPDILPNAQGRAHYNTEFFHRYDKCHYLEVDPVHKLFLKTKGPFTWKQVNLLPLAKKERDVIEVRRAVGSRTGISMPVHSLDTKLVGMSLASESSHARTDKNAISEIYAISNQFQLARARLLGHDKLKMPDIKLTPREKEVLLWCAQGKSNNVIATILGISEKTVEFHMRSAFDKLNVGTRTAAVLKALNLRLITM